MDYYSLVKTLHIVGAAVLFGTGAGIAFFFFRGRYASTLAEKRYAAENTVLADFIFTMPAVILQPLTGFWLAHAGGYDLTAGWLVASYVLYLVAGACWVPVVFIQLKMKKIVTQCAGNATPLPDEYHKLYKLWFILGWPAFISLISVFWLMVTKP